MGKARQINVFDVLRGRGNEGAETYSARTIVATGYPKELPLPNAGVYVPPSLRDDSPPPSNHSSRNIPNAPKPKGWFARNWPWLLLAVVVTIAIVLIIRYRRKKRREREEEEYRQWEGERLPKIDYPKPSEATGPVIEVSVPKKVIMENEVQDAPSEAEAPTE